MNNKKCPECGSDMKKVLVDVHGAKNKAVSYQCTKCDYYEFENASSKKVVEELRSVLQIKQTIVKLSQDRLGMYINKDIARCLELKGGEEILVSLPDKKHILIEIN
jgi:transposase-like protein